MAQVFLPSTHEKAQTDTVGYQLKQLSLAVGYLYNWHGKHFGELGISYHAVGRAGFHHFTSGVLVGVEGGLNQFDQWRVAPKVSAWIGGGPSLVAMGTSLMYYRQGEIGRLVLRPELSLNVLNVRVYYGYFRPLGKGSDLGLSVHNLGVTWLLGLKKEKHWTVRE